MSCDHVTLPNGARAIVCSRPRRQQCACGRSATRLCDWKTGPGTRTCDAPLCAQCTTAPAVDKDLCRTHAEAFAEWKARR